MCKKKFNLVVLPPSQPSPKGEGAKPFPLEKGKGVLPA